MELDPVSYLGPDSSLADSNACHSCISLYSGLFEGCTPAVPV